MCPASRRSEKGSQLLCALHVLLMLQVDACPRLAAERGGAGGAYCCTEEQIDTLARQACHSCMTSVPRHSWGLFFCSVVHGSSDVWKRVRGR